MFEHRFLPLIIHSGTPPPDHNRICGHNAMLTCWRSHKRKIPTTPLVMSMHQNASFGNLPEYMKLLQSLRPDTRMKHNNIYIE